VTSAKSGKAADGDAGVYRWDIWIAEDGEDEVGETVLTIVEFDALGNVRAT
jgi:hypothetical protein